MKTRPHLAPTPTAADEGMSIGALSRATGVPVATLRTWERRYGFPAPQRRASGHRRFPPDAVVRVRLVRAAIQAGMRPGEAVPADMADLRRFLASTALQSARGGAPELDRPTTRSSPSTIEQVERWIGLVRVLDGHGLDRELRRTCQAVGAERFALECAVPLLREIGERWAREDLDVGHEHFASERLRELLVDVWRPLSDAATREAVVLAALTGEEHCLGLHLAAVLLALRGSRIVFLGAGTPPDEVARISRQAESSLVVIGSSASASTRDLRPMLQQLRQALPARTQILLGGPTGDPMVSGVVWLPDLASLAAWLDGS